MGCCNTPCYAPDVQTLNEEAAITMGAQKEQTVLKPILPGWLTVAEIATLADIEINTIRGYNARRKPDGRGSANFPRADSRSGNVPMWSIDTIVNWLRSRPYSVTEVDLRTDGSLVVTRPSDYKDRKAAGRLLDEEK